MPNKVGGNKSGGIAQKRGKMRTRLTENLVQKECEGPVCDALLEMIPQKVGQQMLDEIYEEMLSMHAHGSFEFGNEVRMFNRHPSPPLTLTHIYVNANYPPDAQCSHRTKTEPRLMQQLAY